MNKANFEKRLRHFVTKQPSGQVFIKVKRAALLKEYIQEERRGHS